MEGQITVYDAHNNVTGTTFNRRAKQLVSKQRACWLDETHTAIRLLEQSEEDFPVDKTHMDQMNGSYAIVEEPDTDDLYNKECLRCLAKKRVKEKKVLFALYGSFVVAFFLILFVSEGITANFYARSNYIFYSGFFTGIMVAWGFYIAYRTVLYMYARRNASHQDPVDAEYKKLLRMSPRTIDKEYKRL